MRIDPREFVIKLISSMPGKYLAVNIAYEKSTRCKTKTVSVSILVSVKKVQQF